jgi:hypothetical protein
MEDSTTHGEANSRSASEKSVSDTDQKKRGSGSTATSKPSYNQEESTTLKTKPPHGSQQPSAMGPPPKPHFKATPTSAQPSKSMSQTPTQEASQELPAASSQAVGNGDDQPAAPSKHPANTTQATPRKRSHVEIDQYQEPTTHDQESSDEDVEPADQIATFDWNDLEQRYHDQMEQYVAQEQDLYRSFNELCGVIYTSLLPFVVLLTDTVLLRLGRDRTCSRGGTKLQTVPLTTKLLNFYQDTDNLLSMKTQITLVQHNEDELETKRQHCKLRSEHFFRNKTLTHHFADVKVVEAFKSALQLLGGD